MVFTNEQLAEMLNALTANYIQRNDGNVSTRMIRKVVLDNLEQFLSVGWIDAPLLHFMFTVECEKHGA